MLLGGDGLADGVLKQVEELPLGEQAEVALPLGQDGPGFLLLVAHSGRSPGAVVLAAHHQKVGFPGDGSFDDGPHVHGPLHGLPPVYGQFPGEHQGLLVEGVAGVEEGDLRANLFGVDIGPVPGAGARFPPPGERSSGADWQDQVGQLLDADVGLGEAELPQVQAVVGLDTGDGDLSAGHSVTLGVVVVGQVNAQALGTGGQVFPPRDQVPGHGDAVDVFEVGVLADIGVPIGGQGGLDHRHIKPGVVGDERLASQHRVEFLPDGEKVRGVLRVLGIDAVDVDVPLGVLVARGLDEAMGCGHHFQAHHESQTHGAGAVGGAGGGFKVDGHEINMLVGGERKRRLAANLHGNHSDRWQVAKQKRVPKILPYYSILRADVKVSTGDFPCGVDRTEKEIVEISEKM